MDNIPNDHIEDSLRQAFERTLAEKVARWQRVKMHQFIPYEFFSSASSECRDMFVDEHYYGCISVVQAVAEGLSRFVAEKNSMKPPGDFGERIALLERRGLISNKLADAFRQTHGNDRNDFHHLNKKVPQDRRKLEARAKECLSALYEIESDIFGYTFSDGSIVYNQPKYWPPQNADGTVTVFVRP